MTEEQVVKMMESSKSEDEWNANCDKVKAAFGGNYPPWWYAKIVMSGLDPSPTLEQAPFWPLRLVRGF